MLHMKPDWPANLLGGVCYASQSPSMDRSGRPIYLQLRDAIAAAILRGDYGEGQLLPSVRALAAQHGANPLTVAKAYQHFQEAGLVDVQRGVGMYVNRGAAERLRQAERESFLAEEWPRLRERMQLLGLATPELH